MIVGVYLFINYNVILIFWWNYQRKLYFYKLSQIIKVQFQALYFFFYLQSTKFQSLIRLIYQIILISSTKIQQIMIFPLRLFFKIFLLLLVIYISFILIDVIEDNHAATKGEAEDQLEGEQADKDARIEKMIQKAQRIHNEGVSNFEIGNYQEAIRCEIQSLNITRSIKGLDNLNASLKIYNIGVAYFKLRKYQKALQYLFQSLKIRQKFGEEENVIALNYYSIGITYARSLQNEEALKHFRIALNIKKTIDIQDNVFANTNFQIASIEYDKGNWIKAIELYKVCLKLKMQYIGSEILQVAGIMNNLGSSYYRIKQYQNALYYMQTALKIYKKNKSKGFIQMAQTLEMIGQELITQEKYELAIRAFKKSLQVQETINGQKGRDAVVKLNTIGAAYSQLQKYDQGISYFLQAVKLSEKFRLRDKNYWDSFYALGIVYNKLKDYKLSQEYFSHSLNIARQLRNKDLIKQSTLFLAEIYKGQNKTRQQHQIVTQYLIQL